MATPGADERFALLKQLFDLAQQQKAALDEEDVERFMHLLGEREPLLYALSGRDAEELPSNVVSINRGRPSDESSVDTETEREIQEALDNLIRGRTTIAIAHRLSTLRKANRLAVMERGRLVELGPEAELTRTYRRRLATALY